jgi:outer membrane protein
LQKGIADRSVLALMTSKRTSIQCAALCALSFFLSPAVLAAAPNAQQLASYEQASEIERVKLLLHLAKSGDVEAVNLLLTNYPLQGPHAKNRVLFIEGLLLKSQGKLTQAAEKFRAALAQDPSLTLVRSELAQTLVELQEDDSAKHHLQLLAADAPNDEAASGIRSFMEQVDARKPYKFSGYVSLAPSTNLNSGSKHDTIYAPGVGQTFDINASSKAKSGFGVAGGLNAAYTKRLGNDFSFVAAGGANARLYDDKDFNSYTLSQSAELRYLVEHGYFGLAAVSSQSLKKDKVGLSYASYGPRFSTSLQVTARDHLSASATHEWRNYLNSKGVEGSAIMLNGSWTHAFNASLNASLFMGHDIIRSDTEGASYASTSGGVTVYKELTYGITARFTGEIERSNFEDYDALSATYREDTRLTGTIELTKRDLNLMGFAPSLSYSYSENLSNVNLYDFNNHAVDFRLTKDF